MDSGCIRLTKDSPIIIRVLLSLQYTKLKILRISYIWQQTVNKAFAIANGQIYKKVTLLVNQVDKGITLVLF
jgi:hypothetical protein